MLPLNNAVIEWQGSPHRVLMSYAEHCVLFEMNAKSLKLKEAEASEVADAARLEDPYERLRTKSPQGKTLARAEENYALIEPIISNPKMLFDVELRRRLIREAAEGDSSRRHKIVRLLMTYWLKGQTPSALTPEYGKNTRERNNERKSGRKNSSGIEPPPVNPEIRRLFDRICRKHLLQPEGVSTRRAYSYFTAAYKEAHPQEAAVPSFHQFLYYYRKTFTSAERLNRRVNPHRYSKDVRPLPGTVYDVVDGIGHTFEYDSTLADINLVAEHDRSLKIGRPRLDVVVDKYSKMILGVKVTLQNASYQTAADTLCIAMMAKQAFAAKYGVDISEEDWPAGGIPMSIMGDNGELAAQQADYLNRALNIRLQLAPPFRGDAKSVVERTIGLIQGEFADVTPEARPSRETLRKAGAQETRQKASLTLKELTAMVIRIVLQLNERALDGLPPEFPADQLRHRPIDVWNWAQRNRRDYRREPKNEKTLRLAMLPRFKASFSREGIKAEGLCYWNDEAQTFGWFDRSRAADRPKNLRLAIDPCNVSTAWLFPKPNESPELCWPCRLHPSSQRYEGRTLYETHLIREQVRDLRSQTEAQYTQKAGELRAGQQQAARTARSAVLAAEESLGSTLAKIPENRRRERIQEERGGQSLPNMPDNDRAKAAPQDDDSCAFPDDFVPRALMK